MKKVKYRVLIVPNYLEFKIAKFKPLTYREWCTEQDGDYMTVNTSGQVNFFVLIY